MTPDPRPTLSERANELDAAAHKARIAGDYVFAKELEQHAKELREKDTERNPHDSR